MEILHIIEMNIIAFLILLLIYVNERKMEKQILANKIFLRIVYTNMVMTAVDSLAWVFNGIPGDTARTLNLASNMLLYSLATIPAGLWLFYVDYLTRRERVRTKKMLIFVFSVFAVNLALTIANTFTNWYFTVDAHNIYHRGNLFWFHILLCYCIFLYTTYFIIKNRKEIGKSHYKLLLVFPLPFIAGSVLQSFFYGLALNWIGMALSVLIIYINIQKTGMNTDYLTGVYNRRMFDFFLEERIHNSTSGKTFSAIMIDLDRFKQINDTLGHRAGDAALEDAVAILQSSLPAEDFIARFGGDEFCILLNTDKMDELESTVENIRRTAKAYNEKNQMPYQISFSMGWDIYDYTRRMNADEFVKHMDRLMYSHKEREQKD